MRPAVLSFVLAGIVLLAAGCGPSFVPLNRTALRASSPRNISAPRLRPSEFDGRAFQGSVALVPLVGVVGALAADVVARETGVSDPRINDPAMMIRFELASALARRFSMEIVSERSLNSDLELNIQTTRWGIVPTRSGYYGAVYEATLKLTDWRTKTVLAEASCGGEPIDDPDNPTLDQLKRTGAGRLKQMIRAAAQFCLDDFRTRVLGLVGS